MDDARQMDLPQLLADWAWLRRLARGLTSDEALAEDAVQETFLAAARRPPEQRPGGARGWLATVLRNQLRNHHRTRRRSRSEPASAAIEAAAAEEASPEMLAERMQLQRRVAGLVLDLPAPLRDVVLLSYAEELTSEQVGARLGLPAGTVRWRLNRAVDRLRQDLDGAQGGDRARWRRVLLPLAAGGVRRAPPLPGRAGVAGGLWAGAAVVLAVGGALLSQRACARPENPRAASRAAAMEPAVVVAPAVTPPALPPPAVVAPAGEPAVDTLDPDEPAVELRGVVLDTGGGPITAATVTARSQRETPGGLQERTLATRSDERGRYALRLPATHHVVRATSPGYAAEERDLWLASDYDHPFHLNPEARVAGVVLDGTTGRPVAGARIGLEPGEGKRPPVEGTTSDGDGRFELRGLDPGQYALGAREGERIGRSGSLVVRLGAVIEGVVLSIRPGLALAGEVTDADGRPLPGVELHLARGEDPLLGEDAGRTGPAGAFRIGALPPGTFHLTMIAEGHPALTRRFALPGDDRAPVVWKLPRGVELAGRVVDRDGLPVAGARVTASPDTTGDEGVLMSARAFSGSDGSFRVRGVIPGPSSLIAERRGLGRSLAVALDVPAKGLSDLVLKVGAGAYLRGRVRWDSGEPARSAQVVAEGPGSDQTFTDNQGAFEIGPLPPGRYEVDALWPNFPIRTTGGGPRPDHVEVELDAGGAQTLTLELRARRTTVRGQIRDQAGNPVEGAEVQASNQPPQPAFPYHPRAVSDADGQFQVTSIPAGRFTLYVRHPDHEPREHHGVTSAGTVEVRLIPRAR
jgi:RNA polymerase sigma factor (sigma-70 family)